MPVLFSSLLHAGIALGLVFALQKIILRRRTQNSYVAFGLFFSTSVVLWGIFVTSTPLAREFSRSTYLYIPALLSIGPLYYLYYFLLLQPQQIPLGRLLLHLGPGIAAFFTDTVLTLMPEATRQSIVSTLYDQPLNHMLTPVIIGGCLHMFAYFAYLLKVTVSLYNQKPEIRLFIRIGVIANLTALTALTFIGIGFLFKLMTLYQVGGILIAMIHGALLLLAARYPHFFQILAKELKRQGYEKSLLENIDVDQKVIALKNYMNDGQPYLQEGLGIKEMAKAIDLSSGQLSQLLNDKLKIDFRNFVNQYRVEEAKRMLEADPESNVLSVCYQVGFNSKSAFYGAFKKFTGKTPSDFKGALQKR